MEDQIIVGDYILKSKLGKISGCSSQASTVWSGEQRVTGEVVAVKQVDLSKLNKHLKTCLDCELSFLSSVKHPNIIRLFDVFQVGNYVYLVLEFCARGDLASYIRVHGKVQEKIARSFMRQLAAGLEILHNHHIIHGDLKPDNIFLSSVEGDIVLKIGDFGLSRIVLPGDHVQTVCGTPLYMAPEILGFQGYDEKVDMWSIGAILFELLNGYPPFHGRTNVQLLQNIKSCTCLPFSELVLRGVDQDCMDMCSGLLSINPVSRMSFREFYHHKFLRRKLI